MIDQAISATPQQLLSVACPICKAPVGSYCEERPGKILLLPQHHVERFKAALAKVQN
jgi:hypothetical protein